MAADVDSLAEEEGRDAEEVLDEAIVSALYHDPEKHAMAHSMAATLRKVATSFNSDVKPVIFEKCYQHKAVVCAHAAIAPVPHACTRSQPDPPPLLLASQEAGINISPTTPELEQQLVRPLRPPVPPKAPAHAHPSDARRVRERASRTCA